MEQGGREAFSPYGAKVSLGPGSGRVIPAQASGRAIPSARTLSWNSGPPGLPPRESHVLSARPLEYSMVLVVTLILVPVSMAAAEAGTVAGRPN